VRVVAGDLFAVAGDHALCACARRRIERRSCRLGDLIVRRLLDPSVARIKETELISGIVTAILPPIHNDLAARLAARVTERAA